MGLYFHQWSHKRHQVQTSRGVLFNFVIFKNPIVYVLLTRYNNAQELRISITF